MAVKWLRENKIARWLLTALRIYVGWQFLQAGWEKVITPVWVGNQAGTAITGFLKGAVKLAGGAHPAVQGWYSDFISGVALPNATLFSYLIAFGELLVGIALILGLFTTFAALMGITMNYAYLFAGTTSTNPNMVLEQTLLLVAGFNAAAYGLDRWVIPYLRRLFEKGTDHNEPKINGIGRFGGRRKTA